MTETFYHECGKGSHKRVEDRKAIESNWDKIDWSKKVERSSEEKLEVFNKNKVENFVHSTALELGGILKEAEKESGCSNASENVPDGE